MYQNCKSQQYYNFCTTKYLITTLFYSFSSKEQNFVTPYHEEKIISYALHPDPCVHSYHFAPGLCLSKIGPYYMIIH